MKVHPSSGPVELNNSDRKYMELLGNGSLTGYIRLMILALTGEGFLGTLAIKGRPSELRERLKAYGLAAKLRIPESCRFPKKRNLIADDRMWTTLGVVSALFAGVGLPTVISPQQRWQTDADATPVAQAMVYSIVISFGLSFTVVIICTMLLFSIDTMPTEQSITAFICRFQHLSDASIIIFIGSIVSMVVGCIASIYSNYGWHPFVILVTFFSLLLAFLGFIFLYIHVHNSLTILEYRHACKQVDMVPGQQSSAVHPEPPLPAQPQPQQQPQPSTAVRGAPSMSVSQPSEGDEEGQRGDIEPYPAPVHVIKEGQAILAARSGMRPMR
ncbi:hypothetical protein VaNZ11_003716 [Volvox africanus]|uniref:PGG domain-containing protein n=1 Tax=Volvox africanus TaxID=51714 RepID=A0ABQ5RUP5_9CHLO|nr:hypothetical protein VaNZ11_003716 [Volvox africanus]